MSEKIMVDNNPNGVMPTWKMYCLSQVPKGADVVADYYVFRSPGKFEATVYYRIDNGPKRRIDLEWTLTGTGDVAATDAVPF